MCTKDTDIILREIREKLGNLSRHHIKEEFGEAIEIFLADHKKAIDPEFKIFQLGQQPYTVDYMNRKHLFAFNPTASSITLTSTDGWGVVLPAQTWTNLGFPPSTRLTAASGTIILKATEEVIP